MYIMISNCHLKQLCNSSSTFNINKFFVFETFYFILGLSRWFCDKESACPCKNCRSHGFNPWVREDPLEEEMAAHSRILAWKIPWIEKRGGL